MLRKDLKDGDVFCYQDMPASIWAVGKHDKYPTSNPGSNELSKPITLLIASKLRDHKPGDGQGLPKPDMVNAPSHYTRLSPEPMQVIEAWELDFQLGSALKYLARAGHKGGPEDEVLDLKKSVSFINRRIQRLEAKLKK